MVDVSDAKFLDDIGSRLPFNFSNDILNVFTGTSPCSMVLRPLILFALTVSMNWKFTYINFIAWNFFTFNLIYLLHKKLTDRSDRYHSFGGNINSVYSKEDASKSILSCTGICPVPSYRVTCYSRLYNIQNFENLSRGGGATIFRGT